LIKFVGLNVHDGITKVKDVYFPGIEGKYTQKLNPKRPEI